MLGCCCLVNLYTGVKKSTCNSPSMDFSSLWTFYEEEGFLANIYGFLDLMSSCALTSTRSASFLGGGRWGQWGTCLCPQELRSRRLTRRMGCLWNVRAALSFWGSYDCKLSIEPGTTGDCYVRRAVNVDMVSLFIVVPLHGLLICVTGIGGFYPTG